MPFPGIPAGSPLEAKIDRCVNRVMATGRDKSAAIAICRASIAGTTQKSEQDAIRDANYRDAGPASTQICATCRFGANAEKQCSLFKFTYKDNWTCNRWRPNIEATRNRLRDLQMNAEKRKQWIEQAQERMALKREIPQRVRRDLGRGDFVFPETRSFPIMRPEDVRAAVSSWGRASAVRARGFNFDDFKRRLTAMAKRKGAAFVAALPADWKRGESEKKEAAFVVFKGVDGDYRWLSISSTAYRDRDGEIISLKALQDDVERKDATGDYGPLRFWHVPGWDIGDCTFNMVYGKSLVEGGTFRKKEYAEALIRNPPGGMSIAFRHPLTEPDPEKVFHTINRFERSTIPQTATPSNLFTSFISLKDGKMPTQEEKLQELVKTFGEQAKGILAQADQNEKEAQAHRVAFKELAETELSQLSADALLEYALAKKEYEEAQATEQAVQPVAQGGDTAKVFEYLERIMAKLETHDTAIKELQTTKEAQPAQPAPAPASPWPDLEQRLKALESDQPPALQRGYRASQDGEPVKDEATQELTEREKAMKAAMEKNPEIAPFAHVGAAFGAAGNPAVFGSHPYWGAPWQQPGNTTPPPAK